MGEFGVLLLMFLAGLELHLSDLLKSAKVAAYAGILGVLLPVGLGIGFGELVGMDLNHASFPGTYPWCNISLNFCPGFD